MTKNRKVAMTRTSNNAASPACNPPAPNAENGKVVQFPTRKQVVRSSPPKRRANAELRSREYLTPDEVSRVMKAAGAIGRHGHRDKCLILVAYRHALRVTELAELRW